MSPSPAVPHRKIHPAKSAAREASAGVTRKNRRRRRGVSRGALLAVGFTALQFFNEDAAEQKRLFDHHLVDNLRAPLTHYHE